MKTNEFNVTYPPTGGEVLDNAMAAILENEELTLTLHSTQENEPGPFEVSFWIGEILNKKELVMIVGSFDEPRRERIVTICFDNNEEPATATII